jgi:hypothetical protein
MDKNHARTGRFLDTVKGMLTWDLNPTYRYDNGVFKHRQLQ